MKVRRHLLVVASQCENMRKLDDLEAAAKELHDAFRDPQAGACEPGLSDHRALLVGDLEPEVIVRAVKDAAAHAARHDAMLVLALLGHGFTPDGSVQLYFMGHSSTYGERGSAVDVRSLLAGVIDDIRVNGVVAIIDTCMAAGGAADINEVLVGTRQGRTRISMLLACGVSQSAYGLEVSRGLASLLSKGVTGAGERLDIAGIRPALQRLVPRQLVARLDYDADTVETGGLWLAYNRQHRASAGPGSTFGALGRGELIVLLAPVVPSADFKLPADLASLVKLTDQLSGSDQPPTEKVLRGLARLQDTARTIDFLQQSMPRALSTAAFDRAMSWLDTAGVPDSVTSGGISPKTVADFVEYVALRRSRRGAHLQPLAHFMVGLAHAVGMNLDDPELHGWAASLSADMQYNDAVLLLRATAERQRLRLIVYLHGSLSGEHWPETLEGWLLDAGTELGHEQFPAAGTQAGVESAVGRAVRWAEERASNLGLPLHRIEIAAPTGILLKWRPEEVAYGKRLGVGYQVSTRWSGRLNPAGGEESILSDLRRQLADAQPRTRPVPLQWLAAHEVHELADLARRLSFGVHSYAVGLTCQPSNSEVMDLLLSHLPIVLWPCSPLEFPHNKRSYIHRRWQWLPGAFHDAYRRHWKEGKPTPIADLRAVWDDLEWLAFCETYRQSSFD